MKYEKLQKLRIEKDLSTRNMADFIGVSQAYYWQIENKERRLYYHIAVKIAKIFNMKPDELFYDEENNS